MKKAGERPRMAGAIANAPQQSPKPNPQENFIHHPALLGALQRLAITAPQAAVAPPIIRASVDPKHLHRLHLLAPMAPFGPLRDRNGYLLAHWPSDGR
jgi:hypothetical protein